MALRYDAGGRSVVHAHFTLERVYAAPPAKVFQAYANQEAKARWFEGDEDYEILERELDVRPGGREHLKGRWSNGAMSIYDAAYFDVVPDQRLVFVYEMTENGARISISLATVEFQEWEGGTRLALTEQGTFLDGDSDSRERISGMLLDRLGLSLMS